MRINPLTPDIIIATLQRTHIATVLIEGPEDSEIYGKIERKLGLRVIDFFPCGGKNTLLKVFERRNEIGQSKRIMFIADRDSWVFTRVPSEYEEIVYTQGYCIENDLFHDGHELIFNLFDQAELEKFERLILNVSSWFAFEIQKSDYDLTCENNFSEVTLLSTQVIDRNSTDIQHSFLKARDYKDPDPELVSNIVSNYKLNLRGKFIFQILEKLFQERRGVRVLKYHKRQLFDLCFVEATRDETKDSNLNSIMREIARFFQNKPPTNTDGLAN
jgi:hypothetical protein